MQLYPCGGLNIIQKFYNNTGGYMLELFVSDTCPYCKKVIDYMDNKSLIYEKVDVNISENLERLISLGGYAQVPFLYDKNLALRLYESDEIIRYLEKYAK